jgi:hypothetical protein
VAHIGEVRWKYFVGGRKRRADARRICARRGNIIPPRRFASSTAPLHVVSRALHQWVGVCHVVGQLGAIGAALARSPLSPSSSYHMQIRAASRVKAGRFGNNDAIDTATLKKSLLRGPDRRVPPRLVALSTAATTAASFEFRIQSWRRMSTGNENFHIEISPGDIFRWMQSLWRRRLRVASCG